MKSFDRNKYGKKAEEKIELIGKTTFTAEKSKTKEVEEQKQKQQKEEKEKIELVDEEQEYEQLLHKNQTIFDEIIFALYESRYLAPLIAILGILLAYHLTIAPHQVYVDKTERLNMNLADVRPMLDENTQTTLQRRLLFAETHVLLPKPNEDLIHFKFQQYADHHGHYRLPSMFFKGVTFGLTWQNPHHLDFTAKNLLGYKDLKHDLLTMHPKPTSVMKRVATYENYTNNVDSEDGVAVYFAYSDLEKQGKLSSDTLMPFKRVMEDVLVVARKYRQVYIIVWYPHQFGKDPDDPDQDASQGTVHHKKDQQQQQDDPYKHYSIIQQIIPTRTGLNGLKSSAAVWLTAVNETEPQNFEIIKSFQW